MAEGVIGSVFDAIASPLKSAGDTLGKLVELRDVVKIGGEVAKVQAQLMAATQGVLAAQRREMEQVDEIRALKFLISQLKTWEAEKQRYELTSLPPGVFVYSLRHNAANGEPPHQICQTCFQRGKKSILNSGAPGNGIYFLTCNECNSRLEVGHFSRPQNTRPRGPNYF